MMWFVSWSVCLSSLISSWLKMSFSQQHKQLITNKLTHAGARQMVLTGLTHIMVYGFTGVLYCTSDGTDDRFFIFWNQNTVTFYSY